MDKEIKDALKNADLSGVADSITGCFNESVKNNGAIAMNLINSREKTVDSLRGMLAEDAYSLEDKQKILSMIDSEQKAKLDIGKECYERDDQVTAKAVLAVVLITGAAVVLADTCAGERLIKPLPKLLDKLAKTIKW